MSISEPRTLPLVVAAASDAPEAAEHAERLAARLGCPSIEANAVPEEAWCLQTGDRLTLFPPAASKLPPLQPDFLRGPMGHRLRRGRHAAPMLARACAVNAGAPPSVLDLTAGLGRDGMLLAAIGCRVTLVERHPLVALLLEDALARAARELDWVAQRVRLIPADALDCELQPAEVVYLDPMFPPRGKQALVKKEMQLFHRLVGRDEDADALFERGRQLALKRLVVKRPRKAPPLAGMRPSGRIEGKTTRYDLYPAT